VAHVADDDRPGPNGTVQLRLSNLEREQQTQRGRIHEVVAEQSAMRLAVQHTGDELEHLSEDVRTLGTQLGNTNRALWGLLVGILIAGVSVVLTLLLTRPR